MHKFLPFILILLVSCNSLNKSKLIDRYKVVSRHNIVNTEINPLNSLSVGNGEFAFTADITGMQTFPEFYEQGISLGTMSQWGWHSFPNPENYTLNDVYKKYWSGSDSVSYCYQFSEKEGERKFKVSEWLRQNPHRLHLGLIRLVFNNEEETDISQITDIQQNLDLWTGILESRFKYNGEVVKITTVCHQEEDIVSFMIESEMLKAGKLQIKLQYPYPGLVKFNPGYSNIKDSVYSSSVIYNSDKQLTIRRNLDSAEYYTNVEWEGKANTEEVEANSYIVKPDPEEKIFKICFHFSEIESKKLLPSFDETVKNSRVNFENFWKSGAAVDFSECKDSRANELERRIILSQYLTKIQCTGSLPPQETGLTQNSWYGKFHLEMHWWHASHFIMWERAELIEQQLDYYFNIYNKALATAEMQNYKGVRWPKMTDPSGDESPSSIGSFLIWQQPHLIYFTELLYRNSNNDLNILKKYYPLIEATADFMASYARYEKEKDRYVLGPAIIPAQERFNPETTINPVFELAYWKWALSVAQNYRILLGMKENEKWGDVINKLSPLPVKDSLYIFSEDAVDSYENRLYLTDHPIVLGIAGFLPLTDYTDKAVLEKSFNTVLDKWDWESCWGWDFPMAAMCAAVLGKDEKAIDLLLMDKVKNTYLLNGHNYQDSNLELYLPGNGALLTAVAFMAVNGGFPKSWKIKTENFRNLISE
jgi:hypothetical protein